MARLERLDTVDAVIDRLGGVVAVRELTGERFHQGVTNWKVRKRIPAKHYLVMLRALEARGCTASPELWGITSAPGGAPKSRPRTPDSAPMT